MLSGGRDSVCLLDVAVALCGVRARARAARQLRAARRVRRGRAPLSRAVRAVGGRDRGRAGEQARGRPPATCTPGRASCATRRRVSWRSGWTSAANARRRIRGWRAVCWGAPPTRSTWRGTSRKHDAPRARRGHVFCDSDRNRPHRHRPGRDDPLPPRRFARAPCAARYVRERGTTCAAIVGADAPGDSRLLSRSGSSLGARTRATTASSMPAPACATGS